jgi:hypothetical protein
MQKMKLSAHQKKLKQKVFNEMAAKIGSRCARQCKSHHQKMIRKYESIENLIQELSEEL